MQLAQESEGESLWRQLSPLLEEAMSKLRPAERDAVLLRFFENRSIRDVAIALGLQEPAAQKRVQRATDKLRRFFVKRGVQVSVTTLLASISSSAVHAAPSGLASLVRIAGASKGAAASASTLNVIQSTFRVMAWTKARITVVVAVVAAAAMTTGVVAYRTASGKFSETQKLGFDKPDYWSKTHLSNAGYSTPATALKTTLWAMSTANMQAFLDSCTPDLRAERERAWQNVSPADWAAEANSQFGNVTGFRIVDQKAVSDDTTVIHVLEEGSKTTRELVFKKIDNEWKYAK